MFRMILGACFAIAGFVGIAAPLTAQIYIPHTTTHFDYVPHTTTHLDTVRHGNHYHTVPHTTTHLDAVPHTTTHYDALSFRYPTLGYYSGYGAYRSAMSTPYSSYRSTYQNSAGCRSTHLDVVPHRGHYHIVPHTTSHHYGH